MTWMIGTDEAGYGPNLGPLCVCASLWHAPAWDSRFACVANETVSKKSWPFPIDTQKLILYMNEALAPISGRKGIFPLIDSKKLYHSSGGMASLERSVMIALLLLPGENHADDFISLTRWICGEKDASKRVFCEVDFNLPLPFDPHTDTGESLQARAARVQTLFDSLQLQLYRVACRRVQPEEFNTMLRFGLKSDLIARVTLELVKETIDAIESASRGENGISPCESLLPEPIIVLCDKLGGRNNYRHVLEEHFPMFIIEVVEESRPLSRYWLSRDDRQIEIRFQMKGEANIPTAMASIFDKYLRELSMVAFNRWWADRVPGLVPTAGYPVDAKRFMNDIANALSQADVSDQVPMSALWREK
ncbi:MAG: hypothetical protein PHQ75_01080 [Thermoguttaceae bacterium]|nr:hypothetical protein [Thermoguttaceae bacterium]